MPGAIQPVPAVHGPRQSQLRIKEEELAREDLVPVGQTGMAMNHSAESVGPTEDKFMVAQRRGIGKDRGYIQCASINLCEIVKQSPGCGRAVESKGQESIPSWLSFGRRYSTHVGGRHHRRLRRRLFFESLVSPSRKAISSDEGLLGLMTRAI
jgi:hypothetical protein